MRFGRTYHENLIPEWASSYVDYNAYKRRLKAAVLREQGKEINDLLASVREDLQRVNEIYCRRCGVVIGMVSRFCERLGQNSLVDLSAILEPNSTEISDSVRHNAAHILDRLRCLLWYGQVNAKAFQKLYRRLNRRGTAQIPDPHPDLASLAFISQVQLLNTQNELSNLTSKILGGHKPRNHNFASSEPPPPFRDSFLLYCDYGISLERSQIPIDSPYLLHYAAHYGLPELCLEFWGHLKQQQPDENTSAIAKEALLENDLEGRSPLRLSVVNGHLEVTQLLLEFASNFLGNELKPKLGPLLLIAVRSKFSELAEMLLQQGADVNHQDSFGESAVYIAARSGWTGILDMLLQSPPAQDVDLNVRENSLGLTPLIIACVEGHCSAVTLLLENGADVLAPDIRGWTAKEHAAFRGNLRTLAILHAQSPASHINMVEQNPNCSALPPANEKALSEYIQPDQVRINSSSSRIFVGLGASNLRKMVKTVDISANIGSSPCNTPPELGFGLKIRAIGAQGSSKMIHLPILEDTINEPWMFMTNDPDNSKLVFELYLLKSFSTASDALMGSGVALLQNLKQGQAQDRESLVRDFTIPLLGKQNLDFLGTVTFNFLVVRPYNGLKTPVEPMARGFWKHGGPIQVVGHRGSGANSSAKSNLQIGENTVQSFLTATSLGAPCVEFDVQLTRDLSTAIFHDFQVMETGADIPIQSLTSDQFMLLGTTQSPRGHYSGMAETRFLERNRGEIDSRKKPRSLSVNQFDDYRSDDMVTRMKHTMEGKREIKGNVRGSSIQEPFATLEELLLKLPETVAFDLEMSKLSCKAVLEELKADLPIKEYPMLWEAEDRAMDSFAIEANVFVDVVLEKVYALGGKRNITFSSFSPEMCILLAFKQQDYPVLLISKAGAQIAGDIRAANVQQAIQFAKSWNLAGTVLFADPLIECPRLVQYARDPGLICATYGNTNDDPENARVLADAGLDAIVVNKVRLITQALGGT